LPSFIYAHFAVKPQYGLEKEEWQRIVEAVAEIDGLISNNKTLRQCEFPFPLSTLKPIAALAKPRRDKVQCTIEVNSKACRYICCFKQYMQEHSWTEYKWKSKDKGGRS
jgi:hypothetical protein